MSIPEDAVGETIHVIVQVADDDDLPLTRYCSVVFKVESDLKIGIVI